MAELFQTTQQNVSVHLQNIFDEGELERPATHKEYLSVRFEGNRQVKRVLDYYNLDAIISVGYGVKSAVATRFRICQLARGIRFNRRRKRVAVAPRTGSGMPGETPRDRSPCPVRDG